MASSPAIPQPSSSPTHVTSSLPPAQPIQLAPIAAIPTLPTTATLLNSQLALRMLAVPNYTEHHWNLAAAVASSLPLHPALDPFATLVLFRSSVIHLPSCNSFCNKLLHDILLAAHRPITSLEVNPSILSHIDELFKVQYPEKKKNASHFMGLASKSSLPQKRTQHFQSPKGKNSKFPQYKRPNSFRKPAWNNPSPPATAK